jgi:hypothetical protein
MDWTFDLLIPFGTTSNYSVIANLHTLQITTELANPFRAYSVLTSGSLATASRAQVLSSQ